MFDTCIYTNYRPIKFYASTAKVYLSIPDIPFVSCIACLAAFQSCTIGGKADFDTWDDWIWEHILWTACGLDPSPLEDTAKNMIKITCELCYELISNLFGLRKKFRI